MWHHCTNCINYSPFPLFISLLLKIKAIETPLFTVVFDCLDSKSIHHTDTVLFESRVLPIILFLRVGWDQKFQISILLGWLARVNRTWPPLGVIGGLI